MPTPSFVTNENVLFNGTTTPAVVLRDNAGTKHLIKWSSLTPADATLLEEFVNARGGVTPLVADTNGKMTASFSGSVVGTASTGLSTVAVASAGYVTIDLGGSAVAGSASGLPSITGTNGYQIVNYQPGVTAGTSTGLTAPTAGSQVVAFGAAKTGVSPSGLANDATVYTASITVDGSVKSVTVAGSAAQTFTDVIAAVNSALGSSATAAIVGGNIKITSATTGLTSTVRTTTGNLFSSLLNFNVIRAAVDGTGSVANLTGSVVIDGATFALSVAPGSIATFGALVAAINTAIGAAGTASIVGGDVRITSAGTGTTSTVVITPGTLFPTLSGYVSVLPPAAGGGDAKRYGCTITVDGTKIKTVAFTGEQGNTFQHVLDEMNADLGADASASIVAGNIVITSTTTGATSSVTLYDNAFLASNLSGFVKTTSTAGTSPVVYTFGVNIDGAAYAAEIVGSQAATFNSVLARINTVLGSAGTAAIVGGNIVVTSATTGTTSTVTDPSGTLLRSLPGFTGRHTSVSGASDMLDALHSAKSPSGTPLSSSFVVMQVGPKPAVPLHVKHTLDYVYHDGTEWKYLDNDTSV